jgi:hypothetical protein
MTILSWAISVLVVALLVTFVGYLVSLRRLPTARRAEVRVFDRFGRLKEVTRLEQPRRK